jgi:outer membrane protein insertion porin family
VKRAAVLAIVVFVGAGSLRAQSAPALRSNGWLQGRLESGLSRALGGPVRIGSIDVDWTALSATVHDVTLEIPAGGAPPLTARIGEGRIKLAWEGLAGIAGGRIHIAEVAARQTSFSISRAWIDAWHPEAKAESAPVEVRIDRLVIEGADAEYADHGLGLIIRAAGLNVRGDWSTARRSLVAEATGRATIEAPFFALPWNADIHTGLRLGPGRLELVGATATGPGVSAEVRGNVTWGLGASFTAEGRVEGDLGLLGPALKGHLGLAGHIAGPVQVVFVGGDPIRVTLQATTTGFAVGPVKTESARGALTLRPGRLEVAGLDARAYGGTFTGAVALEFSHENRLELDVVGKGADVGAVSALTGKSLPLAATADLTFKVVGDPARVAGWNGRGTFDATPLKNAGSRIAVGGRGTLAFEDGHVRLESRRLDAGAASFSLDLQSELSGTPPAVHLALSGTTLDAASTQRETLRLLDALGVARNRFVTEAIEGAGTLDVDLRTGAAMRLALALDLHDGSWAKEPFEAAAMDLVVDDRTVSIDRLVVRRGTEGARGRLTIDTASGAIRDVDLHAGGVSLAPLARRLGIDVPISGRMDVDVRGFAVDGVLAAQGSVHADDVIVGREIFDTIDAPIVIEGGIARLDPVTVRGAGVSARARVAYDLETATAQVDVDEAIVHLEACRTLAEAGLLGEGTLRARGPLAIGREGPRGLLSVSANDLLLDTGRNGLREVRLGDFDGDASLDAAGLTVSIHADPEPVWTFEAVLGWAADLPVSAVLYFDDLTVGAGGAFGESADVRLKGQVQAEGKLTEPRALEIDGAFDEVAVRVGPTTLRAVEPFPLRLDAGQFVLGPSRFEGDNAHLELSARGSIEGGAFESRLTGQLDLGIVSSLWSDLRGAGAMTIEAAASGTFDRPDLRGHVVLQDGRLRLLGTPQSLEHIDAEAVFEGESLKLGNFHAALGGGEVTGTGDVVFDGLTPSSYHARIEALNVSATYPEAFKGTYQGRITIDGAKKGATVAGRIDVVRGLYAKEFDLALTGSAHRDFDEGGESRTPRNILLDIDIVAPGNVWVRNDIAKLEIEGGLHVGGELARPELTGRLSLVPGGTVRYRDVDYRLEYGTLDLTDTRRINPYVDLRGRTRVAEYDVTLHVEGTADKFEYELTSLPPLSSQDIISLLVTGRTLDAINSSSAAAGLPTDMAAYYFAGLLNATFGHTIQSSLGIDQFQITPLLLKGEGDPTARVTVGKRVSDTVKVIFSQDIGTAQKQTYQVVMDASRRVRLIAESDSESGLGGEVQYSQQFGGAAAGRGGKAATGDGTGPPGNVGSVQIVATDGPARPELIKKAKIRVGKPFSRARMLEGADRIRATLVKESYVQADVRSEVVQDDAAGVYRIVYKVTTGPRIAVEIATPDGKHEKSFRKKLRAFWRDTPYTPDIWEEASGALRDNLQADGYYAADVVWRAVDSDTGRIVRFDIDRGKPVRLRSFTLVGVVSLPVKRIESDMESLRKKSLAKRLLRPDVLTQDVAAIRALYREEGFVHVRVARPEIAMAATGDAADVRIVVDEGEKFKVGDVTFAGTTPVDDETLKTWTPLVSGTTFSPRRLAMAEQTEAGVESAVALSADEADVAFDVAAGDRKTVGSVVIAGNEVTKNRTIAKCLTFGQGDPLSRNELLKSQQRLYRTGLFSSVKLTFAPEDASDPTPQEVTVKVAEAPPWNMGFGLGYDSENGPRVSFLLGYTNLGGRNVGIAFQGLASPNDSRAQITLRHRRIFGNAIDSLASLLTERTVQDAFTEWRDSASVRLERRPASRWIQYVRYTIEDVRIGNDPDALAAVDEIFADKVSAIRLGSLGIGIVRDTRDDAFVPTRGAYGSVEASVFARPLGSEASFTTLFLRGSWTKTFRNSTRFVTFLRIGAEVPFDGTDVVPLSERYFAGGSSTMRGFALDSVGGLVLQLCKVSNPPLPDIVEPCNGQGEVVGEFNSGGEALLLLNEEWHFPIWKALRGELFLDVGNVYPTISDFNPVDVRSSAGVGLRLDTPIGPIRAEYGWKLDRQEGESAGEFVFAIGLLF